MRAAIAMLMLTSFAFTPLAGGWSFAATPPLGIATPPVVSLHGTRSPRLACTWKDCQDQCYSESTKPQYDQCMRWCRARHENC